MATFIEILETPTAGKAGHVAASSASERRIVRVVDANINAGLMVAEGATKGSTCKAPTTAAEAKASIGCLIDPEFLNDVNAAADYLAGNQATILESGFIWAECEETVAIDDPVCVRHTSDGGSNTTLGKVRKTSDYPAGGITLTPTVQNSSAYSVELFNGTVRETYNYTSDATATAQEIVEGLAAAINAGTAFDATEDNSVIQITSVSGVLEVQPSSNLTASTPARAALLKGARFASARSGAGIVKIRLQLRQD
jgi:hypothetical protein